MDTLTHALSGALLAGATAPLRPQPGALSLRTRLAAGAAAAAFPDIDFAMRVFGTLPYLNAHQGLTHSVVMLPLWALLLAVLFSWISRGAYRWQAFFVVAGLGIAIHIVGDLITAYGLMLFAPFSSDRYFLPLAFLIDPWMTAILIAALLAIRFRPHARGPAIAGLVVLTAYVGLLAHLHVRALEIGSAHAQDRDLTPAEIQALAQPLSPQNRTIIVRDGDTYHMARVALWGGAAWRSWLLPEMAAAYRPIPDIEWKVIHRFGDSAETAAFARKAWWQPDFAPVRDFAYLPALSRMEGDAAATCAWFEDLRFKLPALPPYFQFASCRTADGSWHRQEAGDPFALR